MAGAISQRSTAPPARNRMNLGGPTVRQVQPRTRAGQSSGLPQWVIESPSEWASVPQPAARPTHHQLAPGSATSRTASATTVAAITEPRAAVYFRARLPRIRPGISASTISARVCGRRAVCVDSQTAKPTITMLAVTPQNRPASAATAKTPSANGTVCVISRCPPWPGRRSQWSQVALPNAAAASETPREISRVMGPRVRETVDPGWSMSGSSANPDATAAPATIDSGATGCPVATSPAHPPNQPTAPESACDLPIMDSVSAARASGPGCDT